MTRRTIAVVGASLSGLRAAQELRAQGYDDDLVVIGRGRIVAQGTKAALLAAAGTLARSRDDVRLGRELQASGHSVTLAEGVLRTDADTDTVGATALAAGVALTELRAADGAGLEEMFLELTADTQREDTASPAAPSPVPSRTEGAAA